MMPSLFIYGTLCHAALLRVVLGRLPEMQAAELADHRVYWADGHDFPVILPEAGGVARGFVLEGLSAQDWARLDYYEGPFGYGTTPFDVRCDDGTRLEAGVYLPEPGRWAKGAAWVLADWAAIWGEIIVSTARDVMSLYPQPIAAHRRGPMLARGASRLRAEAEPAPTTVRRAAVATDVAVVSKTQPYANFFAVEEYKLRHARFAGGASDEMIRAAFISCDAVTVLPYDPVRDRVLLVEQFRAGPFARGDHNPWHLEAIAGRIDPGEGPQDAARREAMEEAGLVLGALLPVANYYPTPGAKTEYLYSFVALTELPDGSALVGGEVAEAEDIKGHLVEFDALMALIASGEVANAPLILTALWLQRERPRLRQAQA